MTDSPIKTKIMKRKLRLNLMVLFSLIVSGIIQAMAQGTGDVKHVVTIDNVPENTVYHRIYQPFLAQWDEN